VNYNNSKTYTVAELGNLRNFLMLSLKNKNIFSFLVLWYNKMEASAGGFSEATS